MRRLSGRSAGISAMRGASPPEAKGIPKATCASVHRQIFKSEVTITTGPKIASYNDFFWKSRCRDPRFSPSEPTPELP